MHGNRRTAVRRIAGCLAALGVAAAVTFGGIVAQASADAPTPVAAGGQPEKPPPWDRPA